MQMILFVLVLLVVIRFLYKIVQNSIDQLLEKKVVFFFCFFFFFFFKLLSVVVRDQISYESLVILRAHIELG